MKEIKDFIKGRISHAERKVAFYKESHGENPTQTHNYFGGQSLGYWEGMLSAYHNTIDKIEETEND